jgi:hypothetical protein
MILFKSLKIKSGFVIEAKVKGWRKNVMVAELV